MTSDDVEWSSSTLVEIRTTCATEEAAGALAARLVRDRLAACVQIDGPVCSTYIWKGRSETATEWRCTCKTTAARSAACAAAIAAGHPYETPEIIMAPITASAAYATWVQESVTEDDGACG
ncbi:MAG: divalent-cation tolerance protein CutA [Pirellulales bacterium]